MVVDSFTLSPTGPTDQDVLVFTALVKNQGAGGAAASKLSLQVGGESQPAEYDLPSLGAAQTYTVSRQVGPLIAQNYLARATVDSRNAVSESNESNNEATLSFAVTSTPSPMLSVSTTSLDFGSLLVGTIRDLTVTVTNSGGGTLTGSIGSPSAPFSLVSGGGSFSLAANQTQAVTVRFSPTSASPFSSSVSVSSNGGTATVSLTGTGTPGPALSVTPLSLTFGSVQVNSSKDLLFTVTNGGGGTLTGSIGSPSAPFNLVSGGGNFSLTASQTQTVTVRFSPTSAGSFSGSVSVSSNGGTATVSLTGTGTPGPSLSVAPPYLAFGNVEVNNSKELPFMVTNSGGGILSGTIGVPVPPFSVTSGGGSFSLTANQSRTVTVRFSPTSVGWVAGGVSVSSNGGSGTVSLEGAGIRTLTPDLVVASFTLSPPNPTELDVLFFTAIVKNQGAGAAGASNMTLQVGGETYPAQYAVPALESGQSFIIDRQVAPLIAQNYLAKTTVDSYNHVPESDESNNETTLPFTVTPAPTPRLLISPTTLDFGSVQVNSAKDLPFTVTNSGGGTLTGSTLSAAAPFVIVSGGSFSLTANQSQTVTVRFNPTSQGSFSSSVGVVSNGGTATVSLSGAGVQPPPTVTTSPAEDVNQTSAVLLGTVNPNGNSTSVYFEYDLTTGYGNRTPSFSAGSGTTTGNASWRISGLSCDTTYHFRIVATNSGGTSYGNDSIFTTSACTPSPPNLSVSTTSLDFGSVEVNSTKELPFTVTNSGGGTLTGSMLSPTAPFSIVSGGASFSLSASQSQTVMVRFSPTSAGAFSSSVGVGSNAGVVTVVLSGTGICSYSISSSIASFGAEGGPGSVSVTVPGGCSWTAVSNASWITITSGSSGSGNGTVSYTVAANTNPNARTGTLTIAGQTVTVTQAAPGPALSVSTTYLDFGSVGVNGTKDLAFTLTNSGGGTLTGTVASLAPPFSIVSGAGSFSLPANQTQTVTVRFSPTSSDSFSGSVIVISNGGTATVSLTGTGTPGSALSVTPLSLGFGSVQLNSSKDLAFTLTNSGGGTLSGSIGAPVAPFSIISGGGNFSLTANQSRTVTVRFSPTRTGSFSDTVSVSSNGGNATVSLTGTASSEPALLVTPLSLPFGSVQVNSTKDLPFTVTNSGGGP